MSGMLYRLYSGFHTLLVAFPPVPDSALLYALEVIDESNGALRLCANKNGRPVEMDENGAATGRERYHECRTNAAHGIAPLRSRLGYVLERLHIFVAHPP
jgi:hypothetical protein